MGEMMSKTVSLRFYLAQCHKLQRGREQFENREEGRRRIKRGAGRK